MFVTVVARDVVARIAVNWLAALLGEWFAAYDTFTIGCGYAGFDLGVYER
jgi:hypothetical protein